MRAVAEAWPDGEFVQQAVAQLPWFHLCALLDKLKSNDLCEWYALRAAEHGWSCNVRVMQIETRLHEQRGSETSSARSHSTLHASCSNWALVSSLSGGSTGSRSAATSFLLIGSFIT
jgi:hypothetical protein